MPNVLIFCGSGRNIGKTALARSVISHTKKQSEIVAIKVSPHFHKSLLTENLIWHETDCNIFLEKRVSSKDSSLFLQAGADPVYYIETMDYMLETAFNMVLSFIGDGMLIVCESGKLAKYIKPGVLVFVESADQNLNKKSDNKDISDLIITMEPGKFDREINRINDKILVKNNKWYLA